MAGKEGLADLQLACYWYAHDMLRHSQLHAAKSRQAPYAAQVVAQIVPAKCDVRASNRLTRHVLFIIVMRLEAKCVPSQGRGCYK